MERVAKEEQKQLNSKTFLAQQRQELEDARRALAQERAASTAAAEAAASAKVSLNLAIATVLSLKKRIAEAPATEAVEPLPNALREAHER